MTNKIDDLSLLYQYTETDNMIQALLGALLADKAAYLIKQCKARDELIAELRKKLDTASGKSPTPKEAPVDSPHHPATKQDTRLWKPIDKNLPPAPGILYLVGKSGSLPVVAKRDYHSTGSGKYESQWFEENENGAVRNVRFEPTHFIDFGLVPEAQSS